MFELNDLSLLIFSVFIIFVKYAKSQNYKVASTINGHVLKYIHFHD